MKIRGSVLGTNQKPESVLVKATDLTEEQKVQAKENIGVAEYYFTERKPFENAATLKTEDIYALYDNLTANKNPLKDNSGNVVTYEYVFSVGDYGNGLGENESYGVFDNQVKKPTFLVMSGIHGYERTVVLSTYRFFEDLVNRKNLPAYFPEGATFKVVPVATPYSFDNNTRTNANNVNINRNFDYIWRECNLGENANYSGTSAVSEVETQAITNWLKANTDASLLLDMHTSGQFNQIAVLIGANANSIVTKVKNVALRGLDKVVPYWENQIGYGEETVFPYSTCIDGYKGNDAVGIAVYYASEVLGIPSLALECSGHWDGSGEPLTAEPIAACAEVLGNVLLESYKQETCIEDLAFEKVCVEYVQGSLYNPAATNRLTSEYIDTEGLVRVISNNPDYEMTAYFYSVEDLSHTTTYTGGWSKELIADDWIKDYPATTKMKMMARHKDNGNIVPADVVGNYWLVYKAGYKTHNFVSYCEQQNLTAIQQAFARKNVGLVEPTENGTYNVTLVVENGVASYKFTKVV